MTPGPSKSDRRAAVADYRRKKTVAGVFRIGCAATGPTWVGQALNVETIQNRIWFALRHAGSPHADLQAAWTATGGEGLTFEILDYVEEASVMARDTVLKDRLAHWRAHFAASTI